MKSELCKLLKIVGILATVAAKFGQYWKNSEECQNNSLSPWNKLTKVNIYPGHLLIRWEKCKRLKRLRDWKEDIWEKGWTKEGQYHKYGRGMAR